MESVGHNMLMNFQILDFHCNYLCLFSVKNKMASNSNIYSCFIKDENHRFSINSLAPGRSYCNFENVIFNLALLIGIFKSSDDVLKWMPQNVTDGKWTLVQVMAWCHQATSQYLNQCWPRSPTPYGVTRTQWIKTLWIRQIWNPTWW